MNGRDLSLCKQYGTHKQIIKRALISKRTALVSQYKLDACGTAFDKWGLPARQWFLWTHYFIFMIRLDHLPSWGSPRLLNSFSVILKKDTLPEKCSIYIQWVGSLGNTKVISEEYGKWLKGYCEVFLYGLIVKLLEPVSISARFQTFGRSWPVPGNPFRYPFTQVTACY